MELKANEVIKLTARLGFASDLAGLFRIILDLPQDETTVLVKIDGPIVPDESRGGRRRLADPKRPRKKSRAPLCGQLIWADRRDLKKREGLNLLQRVNVERASSAYEMARDPSDSADAVWSRRVKVMTPFLDLSHLHESILVHHGLGGLAREVMLESGASRFLVYNLWSLLCRFGLDAMSLLPHFDRCGAPAVKRPCLPGGRKKAGRKTLGQRIERAFPAVKPTTPSQPGMSEAWRTLIMMADRTIPTPKPRFAERYDRIITTSFVKEWRQSGAILEPVIPLGDIPNKAQVRYVLDTEYAPLLRLLQSTTSGQYKRSLRGMRGRSWDGVPGPGHTYAIDATRGDTYLRSSVNRAWIIGRPIVYVVVDVWSTAVVGFYVCLDGPSWETASVAIFNACVDPMLIGSLWGHEVMSSLSPVPSLPYAILVDRGELFAQAGALTYLKLKVVAQIAAPYRPDMKGIAEVLHRIAKDAGYEQFLPGAMDARRAEYELRKSKPELSALTMQEFVHWLHITFAIYNLTADRRKRLDAYMAAAGVFPSPAGLWRYGFEIGIGYQKHVEFNDMVQLLLPAREGKFVKHGVEFEGALFDTNVPGLRNQTAESRNFGVSRAPLFHYPGTLSRIWTPCGADVGLHCLQLADHSQPASVTWYEHVDAQRYVTLSNAEREHARTVQRVAGLARKQEIVGPAQERTAEAEARMSGELPSISEARELERERLGALSSAGASEPQKGAAKAPLQANEALDWYLSTMQAQADAVDEASS